MMTDQGEIYRRLTLLRNEFVSNDPHKMLRNQFDYQLQRRRAAQSLDLFEEARAIAVVGEAGSGKSKLVTRVLKQHRDLTQPTPGDEMIDYIRILVPASETMKNLGTLLVDQLGYENERTGGNASDVWKQVHTLLKNRNTQYIHLDEAQHLIASPIKSVRAGVVDRLKTLLNNYTWPVGLILSGTPKVLEMLNSDPQLHRRTDVVKLPAISSASHTNEVRAIIDLYANKLGMSVGEDLEVDDFVSRLIHSSGNEFGSTVEMLIYALEAAVLSGATALSRDHFTEVFRRKADCVPALNIFIANDYLSIDARKTFWDKIPKFGGD